MRLRLIVIAAVFCLFSPIASADAQRGTLVHEETIRVSPATDAAKLGEAGRGHELIIIDTSRDWTHVEAILREPRKDADEDDPESQGKTITGWVSSKALVSLSTPNGDKIVFGEAADSEDQASRRRGRRDAAQDAMRLYSACTICSRHRLWLRRPYSAPPIFAGRSNDRTCLRVLRRANVTPTCAARSMSNG